MALVFLKSNHKVLYLYLAIRYKVSPDHIYKLAHGIREVNTNKDIEIVRYFKRHNCFSNKSRKKRK